jgi:putative acetyltransferase
MSLRVSRINPQSAELALLFERHTADMHADTPPESIHMMDASELDVPEVHFFLMRDGDRPVAMGAFKVFGPGQAEIKSMHVLIEERGRGLSRLMLDHLLAEARVAGVTRLSLETGSQDMFLPARRLYEKAGFTECPPFADYRLDPMSVYMTKALG